MRYGHVGILAPKGSILRRPVRGWKTNQWEQMASRAKEILISWHLGTSLAAQLPRCVTIVALLGEALLPSWCHGAKIMDLGIEKIDILMVLAPAECSKSVVNSRVS